MALVPPFAFDAVTAIGVDVGKNPDRVWVGTGFLYGLLLSTQPSGERHYSVFLVTNKHVLEDKKKVFLKFNSAADATSKDYEVPLRAKNGRLMWVGHSDPTIDVAVLPINANLLRVELRKFAVFTSDQHALRVADMKSTGVSEGDGVFALGFPLGLVDSTRQYVLCRGGCVARIRDLLDGKTKDFLIDATVFPGNSGGPVLCRPDVVAITGTTPLQRSHLLGMVKAYVPYRDFAISNQTRTARIMFEENSGLTAVEPVDHIEAAISLAKKRLKNRIAQARWKAKRSVAAKTAGAA